MEKQITPILENLHKNRMLPLFPRKLKSIIEILQRFRRLLIYISFNSGVIWCKDIGLICEDLIRRDLWRRFVMDMILKRKELYSEYDDNTINRWDNLNIETLR